MTAAISRWILRALDWRIVGAYPHELPKKILVVIPHTSNWDFPLGILVRSAIGADIQFIGKDSLFRAPWGFFFRWLGGVPVNRSQSNQFVSNMVATYNAREKFTTVIAPEGTRKKVDKLRTGFYHIALGAGIPMILVQFDFAHKQVRFREPFYPTGDREADFRVIYDYFRGVRGFHPELGFEPPENP